MIVLSNTTAQTIAPGQSLLFNDVVLNTGCGECHRRNTGSVKMRANGVYDVNFAANIASATAGNPVQLTLTLGGSRLPETTMISTPAAANAFNSVSTQTYVKNCCGDYDRISVTNTGTAAVIVGANPVFTVRRVS